FLGTKDGAGQELKKDVSTLRYITLPNWAHDAFLESSSSKSQDDCNSDVPKSSGNLSPTATSTNSLADHMETLTVETPIPTFEDILGVTTNIEESNGVEADHKKISDALQDPSWVEAMQEKLLQFKIQKVWSLVDCPKGMDVKSAFLYGTINEEVYVMQPPGFQDPEQRGYFILVQVYVDDIIFGSSNLQLCREFEAFMHEKFQMSAMGKLNFFLGLQVLEKEDGIFLSQDKYVGNILKKFGYSDVRSLNTLMDKENPWGKDGTGKDVDLHLYRSMIGSLMYLTASRPDIMFAVCACVRHQVTPKE
nr:hypothetical protein [Tanacetum cinerariifolium]